MRLYGYELTDPLPEDIVPSALAELDLLEHRHDLLHRKTTPSHDFSCAPFSRPNRRKTNAQRVSISSMQIRRL